MESFAARVLTWFDEHGRKDLPWQQTPTPYRVWVSEIMLQQTQVETVRDYFARFMRRFPSIDQLASASEDEVLALWSGLGYYARGRNLHAAARRIVEQHDSRFPDSHDAVMALPGIGRSTAGAILALSRNQRHAILDGNVKRVLARHAAIEGWPGKRAVETQLWERAESLLPKQRIADYTQAMMDLGATLCVARAPACGRCPVAQDCVAKRQGNPTAYPGRKPRKAIPVRQSVFVIARRDDGAVLLERRPPAGIWGGLWCFPECDDEAGLATALSQRGLSVQCRRSLPPVRHTFSHFHLDIKPLLVDVKMEAETNRITDSTEQVWRQPRQREGVGLAAAVVRLLSALEPLEETD